MGRDEKFGSGFPQESMANERTFLAWIRTCIALIGLGFIIAKFGLFVEEFNLVFLHSFGGNGVVVGGGGGMGAAGGAGGGGVVSELGKTPISVTSGNLTDNTSYIIGIVIIVLSIVLILFALNNYYTTSKELKNGFYTPKHKIMFITATLFIATSSVIVIYLIFISNR
ncbi:MAG: YidH family protein [Candidatus Nitrosocosmicus sp.]